MSKEMTISVFEYIGDTVPHGRTSEDGGPSAEGLRNQILDNWDQYDKINISFDNIAKMTRTFVDEAFAKLLETRTLDEFNTRLYFPDAREAITKELNQAIKLRMKIISARQEREKDELSL